MANQGASNARGLLRDHGQCPACAGALVVTEGGFACASGCAAYDDAGNQPDLRPRRALRRSVSVRIDADDPLFSSRPRALTGPLVEPHPDVELADLIGTSSTGARALEVGSGGIPLTVSMANRGFSLVTLDVENPRADVLGDVHCLPFRDETFDLVVASAVLEHVRVPHLAVQEIARVLVPGGRFVGAVAFLQPFHKSYFHVSHAGMLELFEAADLEARVLSPGGAPPLGNLVKDTISSPRLARAVGWSVKGGDLLLQGVLRARARLGRRTYDARFDIPGAIYFAAEKLHRAL